MKKASYILLFLISLILIFSCSDSKNVKLNETGTKTDIGKFLGFTCF